jgi:hypothetical protein
LHTSNKLNENPLSSQKTTRQIKIPCSPSQSFYRHSPLLDPDHRVQIPSPTPFSNILPLHNINSCYRSSITYTLLDIHISGERAI